MRTSASILYLCTKRQILTLTRKYTKCTYTLTLTHSRAYTDKQHTYTNPHSQASTQSLTHTRTHALQSKFPRTLTHHYTTPNTKKHIRTSAKVPLTYRYQLTSCMKAEYFHFPLKTTYIKAALHRSSLVTERPIINNIFQLIPPRKDASQHSPGRCKSNELLIHELPS